MREQTEEDKERIKKLKQKYGQIPADPMTIRVLVVEDDPNRVDMFTTFVRHTKSRHDIRLVWARSAGSAIAVLDWDRGNTHAGIMLDHDLDLQNLTSWKGQFSGKDVVAKIIEVVSRDVPILVHSTNPTGGPKMRDMLEEAGFATELCPYYALDFKRLKEWIIYVCELRE